MYGQYVAPSAASQYALAGQAFDLVVRDSRHQQADDGGAGAADQGDRDGFEYEFGGDHDCPVEGVGHRRDRRDTQRGQGVRSLSSSSISPARAPSTAIGPTMTKALTMNAWYGVRSNAYCRWRNWVTGCRSHMASA
jgi:hypothetical protein